jgi:hypothetical protein
MVPYISGLRADIWSQSSSQDRLQALEQLENHLSRIDNRPPSLISSEKLSPYTRGLHFTDENGADRIQLNSELINQNTPYQAVETCFHEDRHSHQQFIVQHPEKAENQQQLNDWTMSFNKGYIQPTDFDHTAYRWQPTEADANKVARTSTNDLYQNTFHDELNYPGFKAAKEQQVADSITDAQDKLGENYEDSARQMMVNKFQSMHPEYHQNKSTYIEQQPFSREIGEPGPIESTTPKIDGPEEKTSMPGATPEDRAGIETLATKELASINKKETIEQSKPNDLSEGNSHSQSNEVNVTNPSEGNRYERGFYR